MGNELQSEITRAGIEKLMEVFYERVRVHKNLGPIFNGIVGTGTAEWAAHKAKIADFWAWMLLGEQGYAGNPLMAHVDIPPFPQEFFEEWLVLFDECLQEVFAPQSAAIYLQRARMIAANLQRALYGGGFACGRP